jgi:predicted phosphodiesterase
MKRVAWITDIHWDRVQVEDRAEQTEWIRDARPDAVILSGDIGEAPSFGGFLSYLHDRLNLPIYFVLGNHDFWHGSFEQVRGATQQICEGLVNLHYLSALEVVPLTPTAGLIGYEGWGDGRAGDPEGVSDFPRDFRHIADFVGLSKVERITRLNSLGDEAAEHLRKKLLRALNAYPQVYLVTHVPPFREASLESYRICHDHKLPFYCCQAVGEMLLSVMSQYPEHQLTVLCGHTHHDCDLKVQDNLRVLVKESSYTGCYPPTMIDIPN